MPNPLLKLQPSSAVNVTGMRHWAASSGGGYGYGLDIPDLISVLLDGAV